MPDAPQEAQGDRLVEAARGWVGTPFHWEASLKGVGCDCKGLLSGIARECGRPEGRSLEASLAGYSRRIDQAGLAAGLARLFDPVTPWGSSFADQWRPGDVLLLAVGPRRQPVHLALYAGGGRMIHTYSKGPQAVIEVPMGRTWRDAVASAWRWRPHPLPACNGSPAGTSRRLGGG